MNTKAEETKLTREQMVGRMVSDDIASIRSSMCDDDTEDDISREPYFASESSGSMQYAKDLAAGYVAPGGGYYQLQRNDELGVFASDEDAVRQCIKDAAGGNAYAIEQLRLAQTDGLVRRIQKETGRP